jgi:predicted DNA-binding transcriptional regulator AlpA
MKTTKPKIGLEHRIAVTIPDAVMISGVGRNSLYKLMAEGTLPSVKVAGRRLIRVADLEALFK